MKVGSVETVNNWRAAYFLAAQLIATCLVTFDDFRSESEFDVVNDGANEDYTNALRFRKTEDNTAILERRRIAAVTVTDVEAAMTRPCARGSCKRSRAPTPDGRNGRNRAHP